MSTTTAPPKPPPSRSPTEDPESWRAYTREVLDPPATATMSRLLDLLPAEAAKTARR